MPYNQDGLRVKGRNKVALGDDGLNLHPINVTPDCWYYEERAGIAVYEEFRGLLAVIPWRNLRASLRRKDAALAAGEE